MRRLAALAPVIAFITVAGCTVPQAEPTVDIQAAVGAPTAVTLPTHTVSPPTPLTENVIVYESNIGGTNYEILMINADGSNPTNLTNDPSSDTLPDWSSDGNKIAFVSTRNGGQDIYVMNADGSNVTRLTFNPSFYSVSPT